MKPSLSSTIKAVHYETNESVEIIVQEGVISDIRKTKEKEGSLPYVGPGLVDLQVNGFKGIDFNTPPIKTGEVYEVVKRLWECGVTTFYPTVVTNNIDKIKEALGSIRDACSSYQEVRAGIGGIHLEGPFISAEDGPRGAHGKEFVQAPDWPLFEEWQKAAGGRIKIVTLSPEWPGSIDFIKRCIARGVTVSIGHTAATPQQIQAAVEAGASMSTHLGNGAHVMLPRHPNYIWEQLAQDDLSVCMIADGFHLPESVLKVFLKVKGQQAILVSDSVSLAGMPPGNYHSHIGGEVVLTEEGKLHLGNQPKLLAGSVQTLLEGVNHLFKNNLCTLDEAWNLASNSPSSFMKFPENKGLRVGAPADFVTFLVDRNKKMSVLSTYKHGQRVYQK